MTVVEKPKSSDMEHSSRLEELEHRFTQQSLLGNFSRFALQTHDVTQLLQHCTVLCAQGLKTRYAKALEYRHDTKRLHVVAGVGWREGVVGTESLGADLESPAGYAFQTGEPVLSNHLGEESRFRTPELLRSHGITRAVNVLIEYGGRNMQRFGVLEVDSPDGGKFDAADAEFLDGFASLLGVAIERQRHENDLKRAVETQELLTREMSHRVKNSLSIVSGFLALQARGAGIPAIADALADAGSRVATVAMIHDHLWRAHAIGDVQLKDFVADLCEKMAGTIGANTLSVQADDCCIGADRAITIGLLLNELVTNAAKHAYPGGAGEIGVTVRVVGEVLTLAVSDEGEGLPSGFDLAAQRPSLGLRVIRSLTAQLGGQIAIDNQRRGACFRITAPVVPGTV